MPPTHLCGCGLCTDDVATAGDGAHRGLGDERLRVYVTHCESLQRNKRLAPATLIAWLTLATDGRWTTGVHMAAVAICRSGERCRE